MIQKLTAVLLAIVCLAGCLSGGAQELRETEMERALLFNLIDQIPQDVQVPVTPQQGLTLIANTLALALGARDASFDGLAREAAKEGSLKIRELCMALSRAGLRMGVAVQEDILPLEELSGAIGRSSYFATRDCPYQAPNGKIYENELLYSVAFACATTSRTNGLFLVDREEVLEKGLEGEVTWAMAMAAALRLYEALPSLSGQPDQQVQADPAPGAPVQPETQEEPSPLSWIEVTHTLVNIRSGAALDSPVVSQASQGWRYRSFGLTEEGWYVIEYGEDQIGYIKGEYCKAVSSGVSAPQDQVIGVVTVLSDAVYVRSGPSSQHEAIHTAGKGDKFDCLGQEEGWYLVRYRGSKTGYIYHNTCALSWIEQGNKE